MESSSIKVTISKSILKSIVSEKEEMDNCVAKSFNLLKKNMVKNESSITYTMNEQDEISLRPYCAQFNDNEKAQDYMSINFISKMLKEE